MSNSLNDLKQAVVSLLHKYAVEVPRRWDLIDTAPHETANSGPTLLVAAWHLLDAPCGPGTVPLLAWRNQRRFVELKQIVDRQTITPVLMARFSCLSDGISLPLPALLYREFDLIEWLTGQNITRLYATAAPRAMNVVARLADGVIASIEVGTSLPKGKAIEDRHELIARRGVASDRVVDTQLRQESVYIWSDTQRASYTDVDHELFGLDEQQVALVRAAFDALRQPKLHDDLRKRHEHLTALVDMALQSVRRRQHFEVKGVAVA